MRNIDNVERISGKWAAYDSFGNTWKINKKKSYWEAFANIPQEQKLTKIHYVCQNKLSTLAAKIKEIGGKAKNV